MADVAPVKTRSGSSRFRGVLAFRRKLPSTGYRLGVNPLRQWRAVIRVNRGQIHLGLYDDETVAARRYDYAARYYLGDKAKLNFPDES